MKDRSDTWRVFRIMSEFVEGFEVLSNLPKCITIFGSARTKKEHPYSVLTYETAKLAAKNGYGVISGGGPGIMEEANRGAFEMGAESVGLNILLPFEQKYNPYIKTLINFNHFFSRKVMFLKYTSAVVVMPGGFGTLDELFETLTLIQTKKSTVFPIILMGKNYWQGLIDWMKSKLLDENNFIGNFDLSLFKLTDDPQEVINIIELFYKDKENKENF